MKYQVTEEKERLDSFLVKIDSSHSRSYYQKLIEDGKVLVNGKTVKPSFKVDIGDVVDVEEFEEKELTLEKENIPLDILYEDSDLLVINKPRGMVVHPSNGHYNGTLVNALLYHCKDLSSINGVIRPGIVHRIDKDTAGLLVVAKNDQAHLFLQSQLKDKTMFREYHAICEGRIPHEELKIVAPIGKDKNDRLKMAVDIYDGKDAVTHVKVLKRFINYTYVSCLLETGRTHQIRVHLSHIHFPIVGDTIYGKKKQTLTKEGQMLCAVKLSFIHPSTKERMTFTCDEDAEFKRVLAYIEENKL